MYWSHKACKISRLFAFVSGMETRNDIEGSMSGVKDDYEDFFKADYDVGLTVFRALVCGIGTVGNLLVIFVLLVLREYEKATTHWYVLQLAIADTTFLLTLPFKIVEDVNDEWIFSGGMCKMKEAILFLNYYSSILFLMVMSIDRYLAVCHGLSPRFEKLQTKRAAYIITAIVWITALLLCSPIFAYSNKIGIDPHCKCQYQFPSPPPSLEEMCSSDDTTAEEYGDCVARQMREDDPELCRPSSDYDYNYRDIDMTPLTTEQMPLEQTTAPIQEESYNIGCTYAGSGPGWRGFLIFNFVVMFAIPLVLMTLCYAMIILHLRKNRLRRKSCTSEGRASVGSLGGASKARKRSKSAASVKAERNRIRITCMCATLVVAFLVCWLPYHSIHLAKMVGIHDSNENCLAMFAVASAMAYVNSALNPYLYNFIGMRFASRLRSAAGTISESVRRGSGSRVRYRARRQHEGTSTGNTVTAITKIYRGRSEQRDQSSGYDDGLEDGAKQGSEQVPLAELTDGRHPEEKPENETAPLAELDVRV